MDSQTQKHIEIENKQKQVKPEREYLIEYYDPQEGKDNIYHVIKASSLREAFNKEIELNQTGMLGVATFQRIEFRLQTI